MKAAAYFKKHPAYNATTHFMGGVGIGILITMPFISPHTLRWGIVFIVIAILGHIYAYFAKK